MNSKVLLTALGLVLAGVVGLGITQIHAETSTSTRPGTPNLVQRIADKFGLKTDDVQGVFDQEKADKKAEIEKKYEDWLSQQVKDGQITEDQKSKILAKHKELVDQMEKNRQDLQNWAKDNGVDLKYLNMSGGFRGHGPHFMN